MNATSTTSGRDEDAPPSATTRADLHCHSTASQYSRLGVQRAVGLPECATPPEEVYALAKRRGMDFVTITDHDTIAGVEQIADRADVFISEELTASFRGEPQAVHVLCLGLDPDDHDWLQAHRGDVELCAAYMFDREITCALAHPYYTVAAPLTARHRRRLAELFPVWEVRNGARSRELNRPAATYVATRDGIGIGGSDDHAGVDIGRTYTEAPPAAMPREYLAHVRAGRVTARGEQGSAAKWAHAAIALAARSLGGLDHDSGGVRGSATRPDPARVLAMVRQLMREADVRHGSGATELEPDDARCLLRAWLAAVELDHLDARGLIEHMQADGFEHADLYRRACRLHERRLRSAVDMAVGAIEGKGELAAAAAGLFDACTAAIPYAPAGVFLAGEHAKLAAIPDSLSWEKSPARAPATGASGESRARRPREARERPRIAIVADGIGSTHGVTRAIEEIRSRGVPGYEIEVIGTDPDVDRRLPAVIDVEVPFYPGLQIGVPSLPAAVQAVAEGRYEAIHVCSPGPAGGIAALLSRVMSLPLIGSYHTELTAYAGLRSGTQLLAQAMAGAVGALYGSCDVVLSPSPSADDALRAIGVAGERVQRWDRGVDTGRLNPGLREPGLLPGELTVLYAGRITHEKGAELLAEAFAAARERDPRLHLALAGGGPEEGLVRERLGDAATFLGWLEGAELARAYASADMFLFASATDTFGQVILEAQASGLPVIAVARGGPAGLIEDRTSGLLCEPEADVLAAAMLELASSPLLRRKLTRAGLAAARSRTWEAAMRRLAEGYDRALGVSAFGGVGDRAA
ncbi:MAG TPA: glycosyltransferase [Solirubrobacteraceae bacterium]|jgi:glycosyltransferase involved in cell wall biosynthesis/predicted metal-dependent phosphoesterase TrpH|nr:glycosyltransferase [Solirubrobacteraceae bacterium]